MSALSSSYPTEIGLESLCAFRDQYLSIRRQLPWLDISLPDGPPPAFPSFAHNQRPPTVQAHPVRRGVYDIADEIVLLRHDQVPLKEVDEIAGGSSKPILLHSGASKILYDLEPIMDLMRRQSNLFLCTFNVSNWLAVERMAKHRLSNRFIFSSGGSAYSADAAMCPIVLGQIAWHDKCAIAGNNLRRLLGRPPVEPAELAYRTPAPFIIDMHAHNINSDSPSPLRFATPDQSMTPSAWLAQMDHIGVEQMALMPNLSLYDANVDAAAESAKIRSCAPRRFRYWLVCHPCSPPSAQRLHAAKDDPACCGLKIHPSIHRVPADDSRYLAIFHAAQQLGMPVLTHSWAATNDAQALSTPDRFAQALHLYPNLHLVLGHAGGRAASFSDVVGLCAQFPNLYVDVSGDYFDNGLIDALVHHLGISRVLYGSDADWIDPRCTLGPVLGARLDAPSCLQLLRSNAERLFDTFRHGQFI